VGEEEEEEEEEAAEWAEWVEWAGSEMFRPNRLRLEKVGRRAPD
jgi:hypothetical protein